MKMESLMTSLLCLLLLNASVFLSCDSFTWATASPVVLPGTFFVSVQMKAPPYWTGSTLQATIINQSPQTIFFADHQTNCTVLTLERWVANSWEPTALCQLKSATHIQRLPTGAISDIHLIATRPWPTGWYRARLQYGISPEINESMPFFRSSQTFQVVDEKKISP